LRLPGVDLARYNIIIIEPFEYLHSKVFLELGELIYFSLLDLGHVATFRFERLDWRLPDSNSILASGESINIVLGIHLLAAEWLPYISPPTILVNTEQLGATIWTDRILEFAQNFQVWDYSPKNIAFLKQSGINSVKHLRLGFQSELSRIVSSPEQDIDVLFYGSIAPNDRRDVILESLVARGLSVHRAFACYGAERDALIAKSKVVINIHNYDTHIFEAVRVFYLLINSIPVVGEVNSTTIIDEVMRIGICAEKYEDIVNACVRLVGSKVERQNLINLNTIRSYPQSAFTSFLLS
jgi:hypothetical protein